MPAPQNQRIVNLVSSVLFSGISLLLVLLGLTVVATASWTAIAEVMRTADSLKVATRLLDSVALTIIGIAVIDVGKYFLEEEVLRDRELRSPREARRTLTKFLVIISVAVNLEAVVAIWRALSLGGDQLMYAAMLVFSAVSLVIGLGVFQWLSAGAEKQDREADIGKRDSSSEVAPGDRASSIAQ